MANYYNLINECFSEVDLPKEPANLYDPIRYMLDQKGKLIRPELCLMTCELFNGFPKNAVYPAIAFELLHAFTLVHDDIMDQSELRRGKPTIYKKWGTNTAILAGDILFAHAYQYLMQYKSIGINKIIGIFTSTIIRICEGQQMDMDFENELKIKLDLYLQMIRLKTATMLAACMKTGAIIANASSEHQEYIYEFGINIGMAFQIQDDLFDVYGQTEKVGKTNGQDIASNKKTFLSVKALEIAQGKDLKTLKHYFSKTNFDFNEKFNAVKELYDQYEIRQLAEKQKEFYYEQAFKNLSAIHLPEEKTAPLIDFVKQLMYRSF